MLFVRTANGVSPLLVESISGMFIALLIQTKLSFMPLAFIVLICSRNPLIYVGSFTLSFLTISLLPTLFGVQFLPFQIFFAANAVLQPMENNLFTSYTYGNNNIRSWIYGISMKIIPQTNLFPTMFFNVGGGLLLGFIYYLTHNKQCNTLWKYFKRLLSNTTKVSSSHLLQTFSLIRKDHSFFLLLTGYMLSFLILWPAMSYDYRLLYIIPYIYILLHSMNNRNSKRMLHIAIVFLLLRSLWLFHGRVINIFLIAHFYFILTSVGSNWFANLQKKLPLTH